MADKKRKIQGAAQSSKKQHKSGSSSKKTKSDKHKGPRLPNALRKELESLNQRNSLNSEEEDDVIDSDEEERAFKDDVYEYEEDVPEEESRKNRRFDPVENLEYELPEEFEDENVESDDDEDGSGDEEEDEGRHSRLLHNITGIPSKAFEGKKRRKTAVISEVYPESEFNPSHDVLEGDGRITIQDLLAPLEGKQGYNEIKKRMHQLDRKSAPMQAPLPKSDREKLERKVAYEQSKKEILKWEPLVKRNREASTLIFDEDIELNFSTVGAIASEFEPRTEFEKKIASLVHDDRVVEAHMKDGARLLELNKVSVEDEKERHERNAKIRSLLFHHEMKNKRIKKIKSKTYHRLSKKDKIRALSSQLDMDPEAAKEEAMKQEFKRAEERMTQKHKNNSKWAKRILQRGLDVQDEGTRAAISEQLQQHALLSRKQNSMKDATSSDENSSDEYDSDESDQDAASKLLTKAREKTLKVLEKDGDDVPASGVLSLPFMVRGMKKRKEAAVEEAKLALQDYENSLKQIDGSEVTENPEASARSGRMVFGAVKPQPTPSGNKPRSKREFDDSDDDEDFEVKEDDDIVNQSENGLQNGPAVSFDENSEEPQHSLFQNLDSIVKNPGAKTTYEVSIFASDSWRKMNDGVKDSEQVEASSKKKKQVAASPAPTNKEAKMNDGVKDSKQVKASSKKKKQAAASPAPNNKEAKEPGEDSDSDSDKEMMVDGILSAGGTYELPSQADLVRSAFAGDDVEEDFEKDKMDILNEENPEPEKPVLLPGWGQWTNVQKKKGVPSWIVEADEAAKKKREEALKRRKDARLKHVIISEKVDRKTEKLHTTTLPFPFTSKEVFERSNRMPIGPEFNPATAIGALTRPEVLKKSGIIIKPIKFQEVNPHEGNEHSKNKGKNSNNNNKKTKGGVKSGTSKKKKVVKVKS